MVDSETKGFNFILINTEVISTRDSTREIFLLFDRLYRFLQSNAYIDMLGAIGQLSDAILD